MLCSAIATMHCAFGDKTLYLIEAGRSRRGDAKRHGWARFGLTESRARGSFKDGSLPCRMLRLPVGFCGIILAQEELECAIVISLSLSLILHQYFLSLLTMSTRKYSIH